jgi:hypothetical protein
MWGFSRSFAEGRFIVIRSSGQWGPWLGYSESIGEWGGKHTRTSGWCSLTLASTSSISVKLLVWIIADDTIGFVACVAGNTHCRSYPRG